MDSTVVKQRARSAETQRARSGETKMESKTAGPMGARSFRSLQGFSLKGYAEALSPQSEPRSAEWIAIVYFSYTAALTVSLGSGLDRVAAATTIPLLIWVLAMSESANSRPWSRLCRALLPTALILVAYWQIEWFRAPPLEQFQRTWAGWDEKVLTHWGLQSLIEALGPAGPALLDTSYLLLYTVPPLCVVLLMSAGHGHRVDRFLTTLLIGTFAAYALLPHFPSVAPRAAVPGDLLPTITTPVRQLNLFVLDQLDISTSVFPSGHVAVAFSSAFGMLVALPKLRWPACALGLYSVLVFVATVYGRYHYAADGLASVALSIGAWRLSRRSETMG